MKFIRIFVLSEINHISIFIHFVIAVLNDDWKIRFFIADNSEVIRQLEQPGRKRVLLYRPPRFEKSFLLSMTSDNQQLFVGSR